MVRPSAEDLRKAYEARRLYWPEQALAEYRKDLRALVTREKEQNAEKQKAGLTAADAAWEEIDFQRHKLEGRILALEATSANAAAAQILVEAQADVTYFRKTFAEQFESHATLIALRFLRPSLNGLLLTHVGEILDNPSMPAALLQAIHGFNPRVVYAAVSEEELAAA